MGFLKSLFEHIKEIFLGKKEEGKKFLGYFRQGRLKFLEEFIGTDSGSYKRNTRAFTCRSFGRLSRHILELSCPPLDFHHPLV
jgi:hypothetical protein